jgi:hypothetical protein
MNRNHPAATRLVLAAAMVAAVCSSASIATVIAYDHLIAASSTLTPANVEHAEYVTLATGATTLDSARFRMSFATPGSFSGTLFLSVYTDGGGAPGALLGSFSQPVVVASTATFANFTGLGLGVPGSLWVSTHFVSGSTLAGVRLTLAAPTVGSVSTTRATRAGGTGGWTTTPGVDRWMEMSLTAVPTPGTTAVLALACPLAARRRRAR